MNSPREIVTHITEQSTTLHQLIRRIRILKVSLEIKFYGKEITEDTLTEEDQNWLSSQTEDFWHNFSRENFSWLFEDIEEEMLKVIPLIVYVPFEITSSQTDDLGRYIKS